MKDTIIILISIISIISSLVVFLDYLRARRSMRYLHMDFHYEPEPVLLGASVPQEVKPGEEFTARFVACIEKLEQEIEAKLSKMSPRSQSHLGIKHCRWRVGTKVRVRLYGEHIEVRSPEEEFVWQGHSNLVDFDVVVPTDAPEVITILKFDISIDQIIVAKLRVDLGISSKVVARNRKIVKSEPVHTAFASYASEDRLRVLDRVSEIQRNGVDVFLDCLSLHPGDEWKQALEIEIEERELFLLFWSIHAKQSEWVTWEWQTALKYKGLSGIDPHPLDPVLAAEPPEELKALHFGDPYMLARKVYEQHRS